MTPKDAAVLGLDVEQVAPLYGVCSHPLCDHQALCPSLGGTPPPWPERVPGPDDPLPHQRAAVAAQGAHQPPST